MLSKSAARAFFLIGTLGSSLIFLLPDNRHHPQRAGADQR